MYRHNNLEYYLFIVTATTTATPISTLVSEATYPVGKKPVRVVLRCVGAALTLTHVKTSDAFVLALNVEKSFDANILDNVAISVAAATQPVTVECYFE